MNRRKFVLRAALFEFGLGGLAIILGIWLGYRPQTWISLEPTRLASGVGLGLLATLPMIAMLFVLDRVTWRPFAQFRSEVMDKVVVLFQDLSVIQMGLLATAVGVGEEMLFRGLVQGGIDQAGWAPQLPLGWLISSVLFGVCHWLNGIYAFLATLVGFYLGGLYLLTGDLTAPIVAHAAYDFVALIYLTQRWRRLAVSD